MMIKFNNPNIALRWFKFSENPHYSHIACS